MDLFCSGITSKTDPSLRRWVCFASLEFRDEEAAKLQKQLCIGFAKKNNTNAKRFPQSHFDSEARPCTPAKKSVHVNVRIFYFFTFH